MKQSGSIPIGPDSPKYNDAAVISMLATGFFFLFFLVGYVEEKLWWPIQSPNTGGKKKAKG